MERSSQATSKRVEAGKAARSLAGSVIDFLLSATTSVGGAVGVGSWDSGDDEAGEVAVAGIALGDGVGVTVEDGPAAA